MNSVFLSSREENPERQESGRWMQTCARSLIVMGPEGTSDVWPSGRGCACGEDACGPTEGPAPHTRPSRQHPALHTRAVPQASIWGHMAAASAQRGSRGSLGWNGPGGAGPASPAVFVSLADADLPRLCLCSRVWVQRRLQDHFSSADVRGPLTERRSTLSQGCRPACRGSPLRSGS